MEGMNRRDAEPPAYGTGTHVEAEFGVGVDNIKVEGPGKIQDLFFKKNTDPVLRFRGKLDGIHPEDPFFRNGLGVLDGKNINLVAFLFQFGL
jgi:hypothetical protein